MNKEDLFSEMFLSNKPKKEWNPEMEEGFRDTHHSHHYDEGGWSDLWKQISKRAKEERLQREKIFGKPQSKYHR
jgi:hypothetical protein